MKTVTLLAAGAIALAAPEARAEDLGAPIALGEEVTLDPILAARLRYEMADQANLPGAAEALTLRGRAGFEIKADGFSLLTEAEGTVALVDDYNDTLPSNGVEPYPVVADPRNLELNRLQVAYMKDGTGVTLGRQRIALDNQRFVGAVGWRQNEQTFDAVRGQAKLGPAMLDATYAISQRTVFGADSPNAHFDGDFVLLSGGVDLPAVDARAFAYLLDYDTRPAISSQTYGALASGELAIPGLGKLSGLASYARQSDYGANPLPYDAEYVHAQLALALVGFTVTAGYEELGSDGGVAAVQTPLATLHVFNGWADLFLTTPPAGLRDRYAGLGTTFGLPFLPGIRAEVVYHDYDSDFGRIDYGREWNASLGFRLGPVSLLAKYARYEATAFGVDIGKLWLQAEVGF